MNPVWCHEVTVVHFTDRKRETYKYFHWSISAQTQTQQQTKPVYNTETQMAEQHVSERDNDTVKDTHDWNREEVWVSDVWTHLIVLKD